VTEQLDPETISRAEKHCANYDCQAQAQAAYQMRFVAPARPAAPIFRGIA